jgi:hypothetical protein
MEIPQVTSQSQGADKETLFLLGGAALILVGAGLILTNPQVRRLVGQMGAGDLLSAAIPDVERYLKLRSM